MTEIISCGLLEQLAWEIYYPLDCISDVSSYFVLLGARFREVLIKTLSILSCFFIVCEKIVPSFLLQDREW